MLEAFKKYWPNLNHWYQNVYLGLISQSSPEAYLISPQANFLTTNSQFPVIAPRMHKTFVCVLIVEDFSERESLSADS